MDLAAQAKETGEDVFDLMTAAAGKSAPGANGVVFLPYMMGERSPIWDSDARGVFFGMSLNNNRGDLIRAILEAAGYGTRQLKEIAEGLTGLEIQHFSSMGGGARSRIWSQIKADIIGVDIDVLDMNDMAPVGAALLGGVGAGIYKDTIEASSRIERKIYRHVSGSRRNTEVYDRRYEVYKELYPRIRDLFPLCV
jgi:xylulokinase